MDDNAEKNNHGRATNGLHAYSVLMSVYAKENPVFFEEAMAGVFKQSYSTNDFVLLCDGPLTPELEAIIAKYKSHYPDILNITRSETNIGLGAELAKGITLCKNEIIMRADSDDISKPDRAERQIALLLGENLDIVSSSVALFEADPNQPFCIKALPTSQDEILKYAKRRNPFNHPAVMYKKSAVLEAGNYVSLPFREDYYLWVRMLQHGAKAKNAPESLVFMRTNEKLYRRRKDSKAYKSEILLMKYMKISGFIGTSQYMKNRFIYWARHFLPAWAAKLIYPRLWKNAKFASE